jgi:acetyl-CoA carboxylase carboxyltransferase component
MPVLPTRVEPRSEAYRVNYAAMLEQVKYLDEQLALARAGGGEKYVKRHRERGKLMARERIEWLLDRDSPFLELSPLAGWGTDYALGGSCVTGIGVVSGVECVVNANDPTVKGGAINPITLEKSFRAMDIAAKNRLPLVNLTESAGADLPEQAKIFVPGGKTFRELTRRSAERIPTICLVFGSSTAGGAYVPGMSDYVVMVKGGAKVFLAGPPLVKMATNEETDEESLGGAEMHSDPGFRLPARTIRRIRLARDVAHLNWGSSEREDAAPEEGGRPRRALGITRSTRKPFEVREVIARTSTARASTSSSRTTAPRSSPAGPTSTAARSACSATTASSSRTPPRRRRSSSSSAIRSTCRSSSSRTSPASWSASSTSRAGSSRTAPR